MKNAQSNIYLKIGVLVAIGLLLLLPIQMIISLIHERTSLQAEAVEDIHQKWGKNQLVTGPFMTIPFLEEVRYKDQGSIIEQVKIQKSNLQVLPEVLEMDAELFPEVRHRGIYDVVVYTSKIHLSGWFDPASFIQKEQLIWEEASLVLGITDLRGIKNQVKLDWEGESFVFKSGIPNANLVSSGISVNELLKDSIGGRVHFDIVLDLKGSQELYFTPMGETTRLNLKSPWTKPSFSGSFLPDESTVDASGCTASWQILALNRPFPQVWKGTDQTVETASFGVNLLTPVDNYQKTYRTVRYAALLILVVFLTLFLSEILRKLSIHPIQYLLIGAAMVVFYTLLLSISEQLSFNLAYGISSVATIGLIGAYSRAFYRQKGSSLLSLLLLSLVYFFVFVIVQLEAYALLFGSIGVFVILATAMFVTRKIDWQAWQAPESSLKKEENQAAIVQSDNQKPDA